MMKNKLILSAVFLLLLRLPGMAQRQGEGTAANKTGITFIVKDQQTGFAIPEATITAMSPNGKSSPLQVAPNGKSSFMAVNGKYSFTISAPGYHPLETYFTTGTDEAIEASINLDPVVPETVTGKQQPVAGKIVLNGYIRDADENTPLAGVNINVGAYAAITDSKGFFSLSMTAPATAITEGKKPETIAIRSSKTGYVSYTIQNFYAIPDNYTLKIALTSVNSARWQQKAPGLKTGETEVHQHGLFDRTETDDEQRYSDRTIVTADQQKTSGSVALAATVPSSIRVGISCSCTSCSSVQVMSLESYVQTGLDDEWISSWGTASLQAGSVAYRTYGAWYVLHPVSGSYDIASSTCNQAWQNDVATRTINAAKATAGTVLVKNGAIFRSEYSAENNNSGCGNGYSGTGTSWPCISDSRCTGRTKNGHGRGMCQWGSSFWASDKTYTWILNHYYNPGGVYIQLPVTPPATTITFNTKNQESGVAVSGVTVTVTAPGGGTSTLTTNSSGQLVFGANNGLYSFSFSKSGYNSISTFFTGGVSSAITADINMDPASSSRVANNIAGSKPAPANTMTVTGYVRDEEQNSPLEGVAISVDGMTVTTDSKGFFSVTLAAPANIVQGKTPPVISIRSAKAGYVSKTIQNFYAVPDTYTLQIGLSAADRAGGQQQEITETRKHGMYDRITKDQQQYNLDGNIISNATNRETGAAALAAAVPSSIRIVTNCACSTCGNEQVQVMSLEAYVQTGVDDEWLSSWNAASLQAGAVAYRSRGAWYVAHPAGTNYDISSATCHQTWQNDRAASVKNAAIATAGIILTKNGDVYLPPYAAENNNAGCGDGYSGNGTTWACLSDSRCAGRANNGHGQGMCQWGSSFWGTDQTYSWILNHYYGPDGVAIQTPAALTSSEQVITTTDRLILSPNPVAGNIIKVVYTLEEAPQAATIILTDSYGRPLRRQQAMLQTGQNVLSVRSGKLNAGVYNVSIRLQSGKMESKRVVVVE